MKSRWLTLLLVLPAHAQLSNPPLETYSTYLTGSRGSIGVGVAVDSQGNAILSGYASSSDFPFTLPPLGPPPSGPPFCSYLAKLNSTGTALLWSLCVNPSSGPFALDATGAIYILGGTPPSNGLNNIVSFAVTKITPNADQIVYSMPIPVYAPAFSVDSAGNVYVTGAASPSFTATVGAYETQYSDNSTAVALKLDPTGKVVYATYLPEIQGNAVAQDSQGNVWITGAAAYGQGQGFVLKLDATGSTLLFSEQFGGGLGGPYSVPPTASLAIAVDSNDAPYVVGGSSSAPSTPGTVDPYGFGEYGFGAFLFKLTPQGDLVYGTSLGLPEESAYLVAVDAAGNAYVSLPDSLVVINPDGSQILSSFSFLGGISALALDSNGGLYITGNTSLQVFVTTPQAFETQWPAPLTVFPGTAVAAKFDFSQPAGLCLASLVNAATFQPGINNTHGVWDGAVAPGELVTIFGQNFTPGPGLKVMFDDHAAPILYSASGQIDAVVPFEVSDAPGSSTKVSIQSGGQTYGPVVLPVAPAQPGLFAQGGTWVLVGANYTYYNFAAAINENGTLNSISNPAPPGSVITAFMTGAGNYNPPIANGSLGPLTPPFPQPILGVSASVGMEQAPVLFAGQAPGLIAGVAQVNIRIPEDAQSGVATLVVFVGNYAARPLAELAIR